MPLLHLYNSTVINIFPQYSFSNHFITKHFFVVGFFFLKIFINRVSEKPISRSKYTSMTHKKMQKMGILAFFTTYLLKHAVKKN
jgi:cytochrome c oxidase assembly factor CtaG